MGKAINGSLQTRNGRLLNDFETLPSNLFRRSRSREQTILSVCGEETSDETNTFEAERWSRKERSHRSFKCICDRYFFPIFRFMVVVCVSEPLVPVIVMV